VLAERNLKEYFSRKLGELKWKIEEWGKGQRGERDSLEDIFLNKRLLDSIERINQVTFNEDEKNEILSHLRLIPPSIDGIKIFLDLAKNGVPFNIKRNGRDVGKQLFLFDFEDLGRNDFFAVKEFEVKEEGERRRFDLCLFVNGIPLVAIETKSPFRTEDEGTTWYNAYEQLLEYEDAIPSIFKYIQFCVVSDGYETKYFPNHYAKDYSDALAAWKTCFPYDESQVKPLKTFPYLDSTIHGMLSKANLLDLVENFIFAKRYKDTYTKIIGRWMQFRAANLIVKRATKEKQKKRGLIWHWQGSGKTLTMAFSSWKLSRNLQLRNPTIFIIVDRKDLQRQIMEEEFQPIGVAVEKVENVKDLAAILKWGGEEREGKRGVFISLIQKFNMKKLKKLHDQKEINLQRENIFVFTDESHRSQYGALANVMRGVFKNAFIFGFTGTPLTKPERHTFAKFSPKGELYLDRYGMVDSLKDGFTLPIRYEARLPKLHLKPTEIAALSDYEDEVIEELTPRERRLWRKKVKPYLATLKESGRIGKVSRDFICYFKKKVQETNLKAMIATVDRESCVLFKKELDKHLDPGVSEIVMTYQAREKSKNIKEYKKQLVRRFGHSDFDRINREIIDKYRIEENPRVLIVSDMLLTGFDCKKLWALFIYKPLKEHRLLQAIARTNRPYEEIKEFGLVVDYIGVAKKLEQALQQFEGDFVKEAKLIIKDLKASEKEFEKCIFELQNMLKGVKITELEDVDKVVESLVFRKQEKEFADKAKKLRRLYELLSPCETTLKHLEFYGLIISISIVLNRRRRIGMRLDEIEKAAKKTYDLIQNTIGVDRIEKIGETEITKELTQLKKDRKPISAIRILGQTQGKTLGYKSDFYVSLRAEIESIFDDMIEKKKITKEVLKRIENLERKIKHREARKHRLKELFPIVEALKDCIKDLDKLKMISKNIVDQLKSGDLLNKESFLKKGQRKQIRRIIRENIIQNLGLVEDIDDWEKKVFVNLEEEHG